VPAIDHFRSNASYVRVLIGLHAFLSAQTTPAVDKSDLLRAAMVQMVSALDHYVHEKVREGMLEIYAGLRLPSPGFANFPVPMRLLHAAQATPLSVAQVSDGIRQVTGFQTYQQPEKISMAISHIVRIKLWKRVGLILNMESKEVQRQLELIVTRRNQIAHEADLDPTNPGIRFPIREGDVVDSLDFIERVVIAIDQVV